MLKQKKWPYLTLRHRFKLVGLIVALVIIEIFWAKIQIQNETLNSLFAQISNPNQYTSIPFHSISLGTSYCTVKKEGDVIHFKEKNRIEITEKRHIYHSAQFTGTYKINKQLFHLEALLKHTEGKVEDFWITVKISDLSPQGEVLGLISGQEFRQEWCKNQ